MNKKIAICTSIIILFFTFLSSTIWNANGGVVSLSGGEISAVPLNNDTTYETTFSSPEQGMIGLGIHVSYLSFPSGEKMTDESMCVILTDITSGERILDAIYSLRNTGYSGDTVNEGVLLIPLDTQLPGKRLISSVCSTTY